MKFIDKRKNKKLLRKLYLQVLKPEEYMCRDYRCLQVTEEEYQDIKANLNLEYLLKNYQDILGLRPRPSNPYLMYGNQVLLNI